MTTKYMQYIPKTLQEDFVENNVVPVVGSGFSKNGILPQGLSMPDWNELGRKVANYINDYDYVNAIDALSLFESEFSRVKLIELMAKLINVNTLKPGDAHRAFCEVFFDTICTTNFDFLIEHTFQESQRPHSIIVSEDRLPINTREETKLIKLHGDFNHPEKMVITESDFDNYLDKNKILATYVSNLFITKTLLLVGYSFDDTDIRGLWSIINSRLGRLKRPAYVVMVDANPIEVSRFERRNIKVINLKGKREDYPKILQEFFIEIRQLINEKSPKRITVTSEKAREELMLPDENKRLCFISAPSNRLAFLKEILNPILSDYQITPITLNEVIMPGDNWMVKSETLLKESSMAIVDASGNNANVAWEIGVIISLQKKLIVVADKDQYQGLPIGLSNYKCLLYETNISDEQFAQELNEEISKISGMLSLVDENEPLRLLKKNEYDAAVIAAFRILEGTLSKHKYGGIDADYQRQVSLSRKLRYLNNSSLPQELLVKIQDYLSVRNQVVHTNMSIDKKTATEIVRTVNELVKHIKIKGIDKIN